MSRRAQQQPLDLHEMQREMMDEEMREERKTGQRPPAAAPDRRAPPTQRRDTFTIAPGDPGDGNYMGGGPGTLAAPVRRGGRGQSLDVHELLKREAFGSSGGDCDDHFEKNRPCPADIHGVSDQYITLDSFSKVQSSDMANGVLEFNFMVQGVTGDQVIGVRDRIDTVISVQMGSFAMPILQEVPYVLLPQPLITPSGANRLILRQNNDNITFPFSPTLVPDNQYSTYYSTNYANSFSTATPWFNNPYSQTPYCGHFTVQLREAGLQSFSDREGARHHFEYTLAAFTTETRNPNMLSAMPLNGSAWDTFIFTDPLKDVHGLTLVFRNPDEPLHFQPDVFYAAQMEGDGDPFGPFLRIREPNHGLAMGDRVFLRGFNSGSSVLDAYVNRREGHVVAGNPNAIAIGPGVLLSEAPAPGPYPDFFWLDPTINIADLSMPVPNLPQTLTVYIAKRRMRIPMKLRRVVGRLTQYMGP